MKIKLQHDWMGNHSGETLDLIEPTAKNLIERGIGQVVKKGRPARAENKMIEGSNNK